MSPGSKRGRKPKLHQTINGAECKWCGGCKSWLMLDVFKPNPKKWDGLQSRCVPCAYKAAKAWREMRKLDPLPRLTITRKRCPSCEEVLLPSAFAANRATRDGLHAYCLRCNRIKQAKERARRGEEYREMRRRYRKTPEGRAAYLKYRHEHPVKFAAHKAVQAAVKDGSLVRPDHCEQCGDGGMIDSHHDDYARPLEVRWLCRWCHQAWHRQHGEAANAIQVTG